MSARSGSPVPARTSPTKGTARRRKEDARTACIEDRFALTAGGVVLVNAMYFDDVGSVEEAMRRALREAARVFVGVALDAREVRRLLARLHDASSELGAEILGGRQRRPKGRSSLR